MAAYLDKDGLAYFWEQVKEYCNNNSVGIASVKQTTTSTADDGNNVITVTLTNGTTSTFTVQNGSKGSTGATGATGAAGKDGVQIVKLWTNASPTSSFAAQTVSLSLSGYDAVLVIAYNAGASAYIAGSACVFVPIGKAFILTRHVSSWSTSFGQRTGTTSATGVTFYAGAYYLYSSGSGATDNGEVVPYQIYGIKGVS